MLTEEQRTEIDSCVNATKPTRRLVVPALEDVLFKPVSVLNNGFIRPIDYLGGDAAVVQAARVSYGKGTRSTSDDRNLIRYLMRHRHTTPFELAVLKLHVRAPIFVTRQWFRHRTSSINEYSARYSVLEREFYLPASKDIAEQSVNNRQGRGNNLPLDQAERVLSTLRSDAAQSYDHYLEMLNEDEEGKIIDPDRVGVARELARTNLPVSVMTQFYWQVNLWNLLHFLELRADPHAQYEIRVYAEAILDLVRIWVPETFNAFKDYVQDAVRLSSRAAAVVRRSLAGEEVTAASSGLSRRELRELLQSFPELKLV